MSEADGLQHVELGPFLSGPLGSADGGAGSAVSLAPACFPPGYCPSPANKHRSRRMPPGVFSGQLAENEQPTGFGCGTWARVRKYDGQWRRGLEHGVGREAWCTGSSYSGGFAEGLRSGFGVYSHCASPELFKMLNIEMRGNVEMRGNMLEAHVRAEFPWTKTEPFSPKWCTASAGWLYAGQMRHGGRHGIGALAMPGGELFEGNFNEDKKHGFGVRMVSNKELWLETYDEGERRMSYSPTRHESLTVHVEASLNRLRWSAAKFSLAWHKGVASITVFDKMSTAPMCSRIRISDIISLKIGDPITHSFIIQYHHPEERCKKTIECQAGSEATFRLIFLALRIVLYEHRTGLPLKAPLDAEWFKHLCDPDSEPKSLGRFVRGSEGLDERFFQKVRDCVARADAEHRRAFFYTCLSYVKMTKAESTHLHTVWDVAEDDTFQVGADDLSDPDEWLRGDSGDSVLSDAPPGSWIAAWSSSRWDPGSWSSNTSLIKQSPQTGRFAEHKISADTVTEALMERTIDFLQRCVVLIQRKMSEAEEKRDAAESSNDGAMIRMYATRLGSLEAKATWAESTIPVLEQATRYLKAQCATAFAHLCYSVAELPDAMHDLQDFFNRTAEKGVTSLQQSPESAGGNQGPKSPIKRSNMTDVTKSIMMRRSAITTAMLLQSRRQREIVDLEYAEADKLLADAKKQLEQSQAAQRAITLEMKQRAETAEADATNLKKLYAQSTKQVQEYTDFNGKLLKILEAFRERGLRQVLLRMRNGELIRAWNTWMEAVAYTRNAKVSSQNEELLARALQAEAELDRYKHREAWLRGKSHVHAERILRQWVQRSLLRCFNKWVATVKEYNTIRVKSQKIMVRWTGINVYTSFVRWKETSTHASRLARCAFKIISRWRLLSMRRPFQTWSGNVKDAAALKSAAKAVVSRWRKNALASSFRKWQGESETNRTLQFQLKALCQRWKHHELLPPWLQWQESVVKTRRIRNIMKRWLLLKLAKAWERWTVSLKELHKMREILKRVKSRWCNRHLASAFYTWLQMIDEEARNMQIMHKIAMRWTYMCIATALDTWVSNYHRAARSHVFFGALVKSAWQKTQQLQPFIFMDLIISLQVSKLHRSMASFLLDEELDPLDASQVDGLPFDRPKDRRMVRAAPGWVPQDSVFPARDGGKIVYSKDWNTILFELDQSGPPKFEIKMKGETKGRGLARFRRAVRSIMLARRFQTGTARLGLSITHEIPHAVTEVTEVMDVNRCMQGEKGYCNPLIVPGDVLLTINGCNVKSMPNGGVKDALRGPINSTATLQLQRQDGSSYVAVALRHIPGQAQCNATRPAHDRPSRSMRGSSLSPLVMRPFSTSTGSFYADTSAANPENPEEYMYRGYTHILRGPNPQGRASQAGMPSVSQVDPEMVASPDGTRAAARSFHSPPSATSQNLGMSSANQRLHPTYGGRPSNSPEVLGQETTVDYGQWSATREVIF